MSTLGELLFYTSASLVPMALPLAMLLASLMTFGNMGEHFELLAMKSSGISLRKIMAPLIFFTIIVSVLAFFFSNNILPVANLKMRSLIYDIQQQKPEVMIPEGVFYNGINNYSIKIGEKDHKTNLLKNIIIYDHTSGKGNVSVTRADSGYMRRTADKRMLILTLFNGYNYIERDNNKNPKTYPFERDKFGKEEFNIELVGFGLVRSDEGLFKNNFQMMNLQQLTYDKDSFIVERAKSTNAIYNNLNTPNYYRKFYIAHNIDTAKKETLIKRFNIDSLMKLLSEQDRLVVYSNALNSAREAQNYITSETNIEDIDMRRIRRCEIEWHKKFTLSAACFIFFLIGAPLGAIIRKGGFGMPMVISVIFFIFYYIISIMGEKLVREGVIAPIEGMWASSLLLLPIGVFLTYKATNDSSLMNLDFYLNNIKKMAIFKLIFSKKESDENTATVQ
jgi:lipopolysaccharide export system permease protein